MASSSTLRNLRIIARGLRISTGLFLLAFVSSHLLNASLGIISIDAMDKARPYLTGFWSRPPLGPILFLSLLVHFFLGLWSVFERPTLKTNAQDIVQLVTALCVVPIMATHVIGISMVERAGLSLNYADTIRIMWIENPAIGLLQIIVVTVIWIHGCAGLLIWLRSMERARNIVLWVYPIAIAIPVLSLLGFSEAGRVVLEAAETGATVSAPAPQSTAPPPQIDFAFIKSVTNSVIWWSIILAIVTLVARFARIRLQSGGKFSVTRGDMDLSAVHSGLSVLDAFQERNIPHASLCQGRGRCGTCAVRVLSNEFPLPEPTELEQRTLRKRGLPEHARLACQLKPAGGHLSIEALYPADYTYATLDDAPTQEPSMTENEAPA